MAAIGCEALKAELSNPDCPQLTVTFKAKETCTLIYSGKVTEDKEDGITAAGEPMYTMTTQRWSVEFAPAAWKRMLGFDVLESLVGINNSLNETQVTLTMADGTVYSMVGRIVGQLPGNLLEATIPFKMAGGGVVSKF